MKPTPWQTGNGGTNKKRKWFMCREHPKELQGKLGTYQYFEDDRGNIRRFSSASAAEKAFAKKMPGEQILGRPIIRATLNVDELAIVLAWGAMVIPNLAVNPPPSFDRERALFKKLQELDFK